MVEHVPELLEAGIDSLKVEGRMKTALYVATIARAYRRAIDDYFTSEDVYRKNMDWYSAEVSKCTNRRYTTGFFFGRPDENTQIYDSSTYVKESVYLGIVEEVREAAQLPWQQAALPGYLVRIEQKNKFSVGDTVEIMHPDGCDEAALVEAMYDENGEPVDSCPHSKQTLWLKLSAGARQYDLLRIEVSETT